QSAIIHNQTIDNTINNASQGDFIYLDPPYYPLTKTASFTTYDKNAFLDKEQKKLFDIFQRLDSRKQCIVVQSNSETKFIRSLYQQYERHLTVKASRNINSSINKRQKVEELIIRSVKNERINM
ncbi:DNA adenine methylase, partial [Bathymodiolus thermophilus thioautotrophic gill symbiont]